jgi:hypothetical protein
MRAAYASTSTRQPMPTPTGSLTPYWARQTSCAYARLFCDPPRVELGARRSNPTCPCHGAACGWAAHTRSAADQPQPASAPDQRRNFSCPPMRPRSAPTQRLEPNGGSIVCRLDEILDGRPVRPSTATAGMLSTTVGSGQSPPRDGLPPAVSIKRSARSGAAQRAGWRQGQVPY